MPPKFVRPCIPAARKSVPHGAGWLHEPKLDGYRLQVVKEGRLVRLYSKGGYDWTKRLARLAEALTGIPCQSAVIDAELVFPGASGVSRLDSHPTRRLHRRDGDCVVVSALACGEKTPAGKR